MFRPAGFQTGASAAGRDGAFQATLLRWTSDLSSLQHILPIQTCCTSRSQLGWDCLETLHTLGTGTWWWINIQTKGVRVSSVCLVSCILVSCLDHLLSHLKLSDLVSTTIEWLAQAATFLVPLRDPVSLPFFPCSWCHGGPVLLPVCGLFSSLSKPGTDLHGGCGRHRAELSL